MPTAATTNSPMTTRIAWSRSAMAPTDKLIYTLDALGNRTASKNTFDPNIVLKRTHARVFNTLNQLWKVVNAAGTAGVTTVFGYDNNGNQMTITAPLGRMEQRECLGRTGAAQGRLPDSQSPTA